MKSKLKFCVGAARCRSVGLRGIRARWWEINCMILVQVHCPNTWTQRCTVFWKRKIWQSLFAKNNLPGKGKRSVDRESACIKVERSVFKCLLASNRQHKVLKSKGKVRVYQPTKIMNWHEILGLNAAKISLFLISLYLVAIFSAFAQILQKTTFVLTNKTSVSAKSCHSTFLVF